MLIPSIFMIFIALLLILGIYVIAFVIFPRLETLEQENTALWAAISGGEEIWEEYKEEMPWKPGDRGKLRDIADNEYRYRVIGFVERALSNDGPGLAIGRWKSEEGWAQKDVENMLDYLADIGIITERQNGKACQWVIPNPTIGKIIRQIDYPSSHSLTDHTNPYNLTA